MSLLKNVVKGKIEKPAFVIIYGADKMGKSTFASEAPKTIFLDVEGGTNNLDGDISRIEDSKLKTWPDLLAYIESIKNDQHDFETLAIDSLDRVELLLHQHICKEQKKDNIEECFGSYGKWVAGVMGYWSDFINSLKEIREKREMNIVVIGHSLTKPYNDPMQPAPYDRHSLKLNEKHAGLWREQVDAILFVNTEVFVKMNKTGKAKAFGDNKRILYTTGAPQYYAGNRYGLPSELPFEKGEAWRVFWEAKSKGQPDNAEVVNGEIVDLLGRVPEDIKVRMEKAVADAKGDLNKLIKIRNHARTLVGV